MAESFSSSGGKGLCAGSSVGNSDVSLKSRPRVIKKKKKKNSDVEGIPIFGDVTALVGLHATGICRTKYDAHML